MLTTVLFKVLHDAGAWALQQVQLKFEFAPSLLKYYRISSPFSGIGSLPVLTRLGYGLR